MCSEKNVKNKIFLSLENCLDLFSISICDNNKCFYNEFFKSNIKSKDILKLIKNIFIKKKINISKINALIYGKGITKFTNLRIIFSVIQSLSLGWKIPIIGISSMNAVALEAKFIYGENDIFVATELKDDIFYYKIYNKNNFFLENDFYTKKISEIIIPKKNIITIIKTSKENVESLIKKNQNLLIKKQIYSKSIYLDYIARKINLNKKFDKIINISPEYINKVFYKKYKF